MSRPSRIIPLLLAAAATAVALHTQLAARQKASDEVERVQKAIETLTDLATNEDHGIPRHLLQRAEAVVVIPSLVKGGFVIGAKHGRGIMSLRRGDPERVEWSLPGFVTVTGGSIGWQVGVQSVDLVLLVMTPKSVESLLSEKFTLGGSASATAGPAGRTAEAQTDTKLASEILAYSRTNGLFAGATLEGAGFHADKDAAEAFYGAPLGLREVTTGDPSRLHPPSIAETWRDTLRDLTRRQPY